MWLFGFAREAQLQFFIIFFLSLITFFTLCCDGKAFKVQSVITLVIINFIAAIFEYHWECVIAIDRLVAF